MIHNTKEVKILILTVFALLVLGLLLIANQDSIPPVVGYWLVTGPTFALGLIPALPPKKPITWMRWMSEVIIVNALPIAILATGASVGVVPWTVAYGIVIAWCFVHIAARIWHEQKK